MSLIPIDSACISVISRLDGSKQLLLCFGVVIMFKVLVLGTLLPVTCHLSLLVLIDVRSFASAPRPSWLQ